MSNEKQDTSIEDQRFNLTRYAEKHGYKVLREYLDEAISGDATEKRTGFLAMREAVGSGGVRRHSLLGPGSVRTV